MFVHAHTRAHTNAHWSLPLISTSMVIQTFDSFKEMYETFLCKRTEEHLWTTARHRLIFRCLYIKNSHISNLTFWLNNSRWLCDSRVDCVRVKVLLVVKYCPPLQARHPKPRPQISIMNKMNVSNEQKAVKLSSLGHPLVLINLGFHFKHPQDFK